MAWPIVQVSKHKITVGHRTIGEGELAFVIAEVASAHEGDPRIAKRMMEVAAEAGVDAIKFQIFRTEELVVAHHPKYKSFEAVEFQPEQWREILEYSANLNLILLADVFDLPSLELMDRPAVKGYKIHLTNIADPVLLSATAGKGKPIFLAVGGATPEEIQAALDIITGNGNSNIILMYGFQAYPTRLEEVNFRALNKLRETCGLPVGFLDHVDGGTELALIVPIVSLAWGACVIEKHFTLDRFLKGRDYYSALNPDKLKELVQKIREVEKTFGREGFEFSPEELKYRKDVMKNIVARVPIPCGTQITADMLAFKRSEPGLPPSQAPSIIGRTAQVNIEKDETITWDKLR